MERLPILISSSSGREGDVRVGYALLSLIMQGPSVYCDGYDVYIRDSGDIPLTANRWVMLIADLLVRRGHTFHYERCYPSKGVGYDKSQLMQSIDMGGYLYVLCMDDDFLPMPGSIDELLSLAHALWDDDKHWGFISGTKIELDNNKYYKNDLNSAMNHEGNEGEVKRIYFGDGAFILISREGMACIDWDIMERYSMPGLGGEDTRYGACITDKLPCYGATGAVGYHLALASARWDWETPTDTLMVELLKDKVSSDTIKKTFPYLIEHIK
jgi:hypothetical protein